jgi:cytochrome d ubiquinol oxidase subunit II
MDWPLLWFVITGVLLAGYAVLDGFDLGVGILHPFVARDDHERRVVLNSIGPLWDGNEVWLVTFGGALFAAFPEAYATVFSAFYLPFVALLGALIFRATAIEFRSKVQRPMWRRLWDGAFFAASTLASFLMGTAVGNLVWGLPLDGRSRFTGNVLDLLNPYSLSVGVLAVCLFAMHGSLFLYLKTEGELQERITGFMWRTFGVFNVMYILVTMATLVLRPEVTRHLQAYPAAWLLVVLNVLAVGNVARCIYEKRPGLAFLSSTTVVVCLVTLFGAALFPEIVPSRLPDGDGLTLYEAASSTSTLQTMGIVAAIGMPLVLSYTVAVYWTFRGKVTIDEHSY